MLKKFCDRCDRLMAPDFMQTTAPSLVMKIIREYTADADLCDACILAFNKWWSAPKREDFGNTCEGSGRTVSHQPEA